MTIVDEKIITKPWKGNATGSLVVSIPKRVAQNCKLSDKSYITIYDSKGQIVIQKLNLEEVDDQL